MRRAGGWAADADNNKSLFLLSPSLFLVSRLDGRPVPIAHYNTLVPINTHTNTTTKTTTTTTTEGKKRKSTMGRITLSNVVVVVCCPMSLAHGQWWNKRNSLFILMMTNCEQEQERERQEESYMYNHSIQAFGNDGAIITTYDSSRRRRMRPYLLLFLLLVIFIVVRIDSLLLYPVSPAAAAFVRWVIHLVQYFKLLFLLFLLFLLNKKKRLPGLFLFLSPSIVEDALAWR